MRAARRLLTWLRRPAAAVVLIALLGASVWSLDHKYWDGSVIDWLRSGEYYSDYNIRPGDNQAIAAYMVRERGSGEWRIIDTDEESFDEMSRLLYDRPDDVLSCIVFAGVHRFGVYAPTRELESHEVAVSPMGNNYAAWTSDELARARAYFVEWSSRQRGGRPGDLLAKEADWRRTRVVWTGWAHNGVVVVLLAALAYSLRWNLSPAVWRGRRRKGRLARGECPGCRYEIGGLRERKCPECGEAWEEDPGISGSASESRG